LFQLIGCTQQPPLTTRADGKIPKETPRHDTPKAPQAPKITASELIGGLVLVGVGVGTLICCFISRARRVRTPKPSMKNSKDLDREDESAVMTHLNARLSHGELTDARKR